MLQQDKTENGCVLAHRVHTAGMEVTKEMEIQVYTYEQLDREIKRTMKRSADDLVKMGYLLRQMQEEHLWEGRFNCLDEYLDRELHMDYTMVTRFIKANKKYSSDTDNMKIDTKWSEFSQSVLIEMLNMPPELEEKVTPDMTVKQVREVKKQKNAKMKPDVRGLMDDPYCAVCGEALDDSGHSPKCPNCGQVQDWEWYDRTFGDDGRTKETVIDGEYREIPEKKSAYGLSKTEYVATSQDSVLTESDKEEVQTGAVSDLEREQEQEQPELPILKNESQRKEWLNNYEAWGLWYRDENIDVNYYKFDFEDGSRLIVSEYPQRLPSYSIKKKDIHCYHLLVKDSGDFRGRKFNELYCPDSDLELYLTEFLKDLQKKGGRKT